MSLISAVEGYLVSLVKNHFAELLVAAVKAAESNPKFAPYKPLIEEFLAELQRFL